jgi:hypothetical protein
MKNLKRFSPLLLAALAAGCGGGSSGGGDAVQLSTFVVDLIQNTSDTTDPVEINGLEFEIDESNAVAFDAVLP